MTASPPPTLLPPGHSLSSSHRGLIIAPASGPLHWLCRHLECPAPPLWLASQHCSAQMPPSFPTSQYPLHSFSSLISDENPLVYSLTFLWHLPHNVASFWLRDHLPQPHGHPTKPEPHSQGCQTRSSASRFSLPRCQMMKVLHRPLQKSSRERGPETPALGGQQAPEQTVLRPSSPP